MCAALLCTCLQDAGGWPGTTQLHSLLCPEGMLREQQPWDVSSRSSEDSATPPCKWKAGIAHRISQLGACLNGPNLHSLWLCSCFLRNCCPPLQCCPSSSIFSSSSSKGERLPGVQWAGSSAERKTKKGILPSRETLKVEIVKVKRKKKSCLHDLEPWARCLLADGQLNSPNTLSACV